MKKISWRVGDVIEYEDKTPRTDFGVVEERKERERPWHFDPLVVVRRLRDGETIEVEDCLIRGRADVIAATAALAQKPLSLRFRHATLGEHVHVDVFTGPPGATLGNSGKLVMRVDEWMSFVLGMTSLGSVLPAFDVSFVERE